MDTQILRKAIQEDGDFLAELTLYRTRSNRNKDIYSVVIERIKPNNDYAKTFYRGYEIGLADETWDLVVKENPNYKSCKHHFPLLGCHWCKCEKRLRKTLPALNKIAEEALQ